MSLPYDVDFRTKDDGGVISWFAHTGHIDERACPNRKNGPWWNQNTYTAGLITSKEGANSGISIGIVVGNDSPEMNRVTLLGLVRLQAMRSPSCGQSGQRFGEPCLVSVQRRALQKKTGQARLKVTTRRSEGAGVVCQWREAIGYHDFPIGDTRMRTSPRETSLPGSFFQQFPFQQERISARASQAGTSSGERVSQGHPRAHARMNLQPRGCASQATSEAPLLRETIERRNGCWVPGGRTLRPSTKTALEPHCLPYQIVRMIPKKISVDKS